MSGPSTPGPADGAPPGESTDERSQRDRQREETRGRLFEAALREFREVGFARAQIDRIARAAGVVRGTFYFHFPKKEHVLLELRARAQAPVVEALRGLDPQRASVTEALEAILTGTQASEALVDDLGLMRDMISTYVGQSVDPAYDDQAQELTEALSRAFRGLAKRGELRAGLDPEKAATLVLTSLYGLFALARGGPAEHRKDMEDLMELLRGGLAGAGSRGPA